MPLRTEHKSKRSGQEEREAVLRRRIFGKDGFHLAKIQMVCNRGHINVLYLYVFGVARGRVVVKAVCYKLEGRGFEIRCHE
jgi:hypothetical protein